MTTATYQGTVYRINVSSGGVPKRAIPEAVLNPLGLVGDDHNDKAHGGPDRALCLYSLELIQGLQAEGHPVEPGALGENLTVIGIPFDRLAPGDRLRIGATEIELTAATTPCKTIAGAFHDGDFSRILASRHPGWSRFYARVLVPGVIREGDTVQVLAPRKEPEDLGEGQPNQGQ